MRQIAYVAESGEIRVRDLDVGHEISVSAEESALPDEEGSRFANWPTWSPDGSRLAYFRYEVHGNELVASGVRVVGADGTRNVAAYTATNEAPIYMGWSPDGRRIAVLVQLANQLYLRVIDPEGERPPLTVAQGAPLYFTWQPDSRGLVANVGTGRAAEPHSRLLWIRIEGGQVVQEQVERRPATAFRAPVWSSTRAAAVVALQLEAGVEGSEACQVATVADRVPQPLFTAGLAPALIPSPTGDLVACAWRPNVDAALYAGVTLYDLASGSEQRIIEDPIIAYFWTPDGRRIIYVSGEISDRAVFVRTVDVSAGSREDLGWVRPTRDMFLLFSHFDQYVQSASLVSPDGAELVLAASRAKERENGVVPTVRQVLVRSLAGAHEETTVARGRLAFWRPAAQ
ncbi:MAG TPA: hypothetical protein VFC51_14715 [Chloroflexota bacterium]|nr:hypothetical protein [Chloroflexota bacterium]